MSLIKKNEFKQMTEQQLRGKLLELEKELLKVNGQRAMHTSLENPGKVKLIRKTKARIFTRLNEMKRKPLQARSPANPAQEIKKQVEKPKTPAKETGGKSKRHE